VLGWVGVGSWLLYASGATSTYSCFRHGLLQTQTFLVAFAAGFLLTAIPRRTSSAPASVAELVSLAAALTATSIALNLEAVMAAEACSLLVFAILLQFAVRRLLRAGSGRRPPAAFALIPFGMLDGVAGAALLLARGVLDAPAWTLGLGQLLIEQGVFLSFAVGVGGLVLPLMSGAPPPADLGSSPATIRRALLYALGGVLLIASFALEVAGAPATGQLLRAAVVAVGLAFGAGAWRRPLRPGLHRQLVWLSCWLLPTGLVLAALFPDYRVPSLHVVFIGGFGLMAYGVASHVLLSHLGFEAEAMGRPWAVVGAGAGLLLALCARLAADFSHTYFDHLGWAAGLWIAGTAIWLVDAGRRIIGSSADASRRPS
jgi:uncharacterized protein involved in response to NO